MILEKLVLFNGGVRSFLKEKFVLKANLILSKKPWVARKNRKNAVLLKLGFGGRFKEVLSFTNSFGTKFLLY